MCRSCVAFGQLSLLTTEAVQFGAAAKVDAKIGEEWVKFTGEMYLSQQSVSAH